ncbi:sigma-70 family RNA polymerase sigma factor [Halomonas caseinilytica]|uniref:RNA polymerase sigma-70 factor, ECF subfamily n=1 Tax=Halomonas caseinilytica TaxID=438744 RepID=A0A1M6NZF7_9GAMM|nr:sigma-70 family RNA polymerase sigma factor [Halomonas caseinilytica]SEM24581.1 RNA polymerase sigma-70 factor, ECF subfamily [Halomonas caseinilytica]SHK01038.1 RNA polymerase sigma-70 factor, ECF subfamily [Halomonas caseinilytica]
MSDNSWPSSAHCGDTSSATPSSNNHLRDLLQLITQSDRRAFAQLYEATSAKLYGTVLRILKDRSRADDVIQEVYVTIWQKASQFETSRASPITWMVTIARHAAIDELRRQPRTPHESEDALSQTSADEISAQECIEHEQDVRHLHACLEELEARHQNMVRLAYLDGWSRADLAAYFEQPVNTVKTWLHRALKQLKGCLAS